MIGDADGGVEEEVAIVVRGSSSSLKADTDGGSRLPLVPFEELLFDNNAFASDVDGGSPMVLDRWRCKDSRTLFVPSCPFVQQLLCLLLRQPLNKR